MQSGAPTNQRPGERSWRRAASAAALALTLLIFGLAVGSASAARADREHMVDKGQTLARIAARYGVSITTLAAANGLTRNSPLREGQVLTVPPRGVVYVGAGDTLAGIARKHDVSAAELARFNKLGDGSRLREGQRLVLPGFEPARTLRAAEQRWGTPKRRGTATLHRLSTHVTRRMQLVDNRGRVRPPARRSLGLLLRPRDSRRIKEPHPRLVRLLARISDHFGGRPIHIVSGYRKPGGNTRATSRHVAGQAIDFRIPGVSLEALRDYCARLDHVGVGYYPRSNFVHLDVRRSNARWTDLAGPGESARIQRVGTAPAVALDTPAASAPAVEVRADGITSASRRLVVEPTNDEPEAADDGQPPIDDAAPESDAVVP
jgi:uncharacterized protein YcbK (DUF882 family)